MSSPQCAPSGRGRVENSQWKLADGSTGTLAGSHGDQLVLLVTKPNWPFPKMVTVKALDCEPIKPQPMDTHKLEEARW